MIGSFLGLISRWIYLGSLQFFVQPLQYFQLFFLSVVHCLFAQKITCFQKHVYAFVDFLGKLLVSALKTLETFVEISQKLELFSSFSQFLK
jgi:hypothetical protein